MTDYRTGDADVGRRLDVVVAAVTGWSRSQAAAAIDEGRVVVDGVAARRALRVAADMAITITMPVATMPAPSVIELPQILYRDDHLLVINKPAGLVVHHGAGHRDDTLVDALRSAGVPLAGAAGVDRPGIVHRLDRDTSGAMVVACTDVAYHSLVAALRARQITRRYLALAIGEPADALGRIEGPIGRDERQRTRFTVSAAGKPAVTRYRVTSTAQIREGDTPVTVSLLDLHLETGRTHQIRVHLQALGHPVLGDPHYGDDRTANAATTLRLRRCALHAWQLSLQHPVDGQPLTLTAPLADDLQAAVATAGLQLPTEGWPAAEM